MIRRRFIAGSKLVVANIRKEKDGKKTLELDYTKLLSRISSSAALSTSTWAEDSGSISIDASSDSSNVASVTFSGGEHGDKLYLENTMTADTGDIIKRAFSVKIEEVSSNFVASDSYA